MNFSQTSKSKGKNVELKQISKSKKSERKIKLHSLQIVKPEPYITKTLLTSKHKLCRFLKPAYHLLDE